MHLDRLDGSEDEAESVESCVLTSCSLFDLNKHFQEMHDNGPKDAVFQAILEMCKRFWIRLRLLPA